MTMNNEQIVRDAYQVAEIKDIPGWIACFTEDGTFIDESIRVTYRGKELGRPVESYAKAFSDMTPLSWSWRCRARTRDRWHYPLETFPLQARGWMRRVAMYFA